MLVQAHIPGKGIINYIAQRGMFIGVCGAQGNTEAAGHFYINF